MSLKLWLPLNNDFTNLGCSNITFNKHANNTFVDGKIGKALGATANNSSTITLTGLSSLLANGKQYSLCCWVKLTDTLTGSWVIQLGSNQCGLWWGKSEARWVWNENDNGKRCANPTISDDYNNWHHLVTTIDKTNPSAIVAKHYVDGLPAASYETQTWNNGSNIEPTGDTITLYPYAAILNDIRLYDHVLSAAEVHEIAQGLILHYRLNDITNGIIDSSGYGHNGEIINSITTTTDTPRYNNCTHMSATNQKIKISNFPTEEFGNSYSFTWWAKISSATPMHWGFSDGIRLSGMYTGRLWYTNDGSNNPLYIPGTTTQVTAPSTGVWHHYAMIGDGTTCKVYLDGEFWAQAKNYKAISGTTIYINGWDTSTNYSSNNLSISDFRIYCTPLLDTDIKLLYNIGMKIDNLGQLHTFEFLEDDTEELTKNGILKTNELEEQNALLAKLKKEKGWLSSNFIEI